MFRFCLAAASILTWNEMSILSNEVTCNCAQASCIFRELPYNSNTILWSLSWISSAVFRAGHSYRKNHLRITLLPVISWTALAKSAFAFCNQLFSEAQAFHKMQFRNQIFEYCPEGSQLQLGVNCKFSDFQISRSKFPINAWNVFEIA
jgi:hypothetical protein